MKFFIRLYVLLFLVSGCSTTRNTPLKKDDGVIEINFVQVNDVYEIAPLSGGTEGGVARIATIKQQYLKQNPNSFLVIAGDFLSPSVYNSLQYEGKAIRGRQMIDALNVAGTDFACFGNHEFDIREQELLDRIDESKFQWVASNSFHKINDSIRPFRRKNGEEIPRTIIMDVEDADGTRARIGFIGICLPFNRADYVYYVDALVAAKASYNQLKDSVDAVVAITHQNMWEDEMLAKEIPGLALIMGGHEHDQRIKKVGRIYITKAMANAKSAYIVKLQIYKKRNKTKKIEVRPFIEILDNRVPLDSATNLVVKKWSQIAETNYASLGFSANRVVKQTGEPLDGRELVIRSQPTNLGRLITNSMMAAAPLSEVAILNSGSIRVDDVLHTPISEYDIIRTLPFGGAIREVEMTGALLVKVLEQGKKNVGNGGFLIYNEAVKLDLSGAWMLKNEPIDPERIYHVAFSEFLLTGKEANLEYLQPKNPGIKKVFDLPSEKTNPLNDIRLAVIQYLLNNQ